MTPSKPSRELRGVGGWLIVFFVQMILTSAALAFGLWLVLVRTDFSFSSSMNAFSLGMILVTCLTLIMALLLMAHRKPSGVALAERAIILTFLATIHLSVLHRVSDVPFLEVLLFGTGSLLVWMMYLGLGTRIAGKAYHVDFSRRMAATYPPEKRYLSGAVRWLYNILIAAYIYLIADILWTIVQAAA